MLAFSSANRYTKKFYKNSSRLQYIAELDAAGCQDLSLDAPYGPKDAHDHTLSISERLNYLRTREARWRELNLLKNAASIPFPDNVEVSIYDLSAGVFAYGESHRDDEFKYVDLREISRRSKSVELKAKSKTSAKPVLPPTDVPWESFPFEGNVADFCLALREHDLIALISFSHKEHELSSVSVDCMQVIRLHLFRFSTRQPHQLAKDPLLKLAEKPLTYHRPSPVIEVAGKYIVVLLTFPRAVGEVIIEDLFVYNWQAGRLILHQTYDTSMYDCLAFVTPSLFVMPNIPDNSLDLVHIFTASDGVERVCWLRKLRLPELVKSFKLCSASCRGDPNPTATTPDCMNREGYPVDPGLHSVHEKRWGAAGYGISADPLRAIISFNFMIVSDLASQAVNVVIHRSTLARLALDGLEQRKMATLGGDVDGVLPETKWEDWGPGVTRWRLEEDTVHWDTTTAGQRQVFSALSSDNSFRPTIVVRDYNPFEVRRAKASGRDIYINRMDEVCASDPDDEDEIGVGEYGDDYEETDSGGSPEEAIVHLEAHMMDALWPNGLENAINGDLVFGDLDISNTPSPASARDSSCDNSADAHPCLTRISVRMGDTDPDVGRPYYKKGSLRSGLPCVEYTVEGNDFLYTGLLMDEERIIGHLEELSASDLVDKMLQMSVFSMYP